MTDVERVTVSRKTPGDGKLEISEMFARALGGAGTTLEVQIGGKRAAAGVTELSCTCAKAALSGSHIHYFVECAAFRDLPVGTPLELRGKVGHLVVLLA